MATSVYSNAQGQSTRKTYSSLVPQLAQNLAVSLRLVPQLAQNLAGPAAA